MNIKSILVVTDLSARENIAVQRAWQLADAQAQAMNLVVLPHRHERSTAAFFRGQPVLRLLRGCNCPVLVVREARGARYERVLVAVDFPETSESLVKLAASFDASAEIEATVPVAARRRPTGAGGNIARPLQSAGRMS
jgi:hypothetical protein